MNAKALQPVAARAPPASVNGMAARPELAFRRAVAATQAYEGQEDVSSWMVKEHRVSEQLVPQPHSSHAADGSGDALQWRIGSSDSSHNPGRHSEHPQGLPQQRHAVPELDCLAKQWQPRAVTVKITHAQNITELLVLLGQHAVQLDSIHVSAAVKHACRVLQLQLQVPSYLSNVQTGETMAQQQQALQWLAQLQGNLVQVRVQQLQQLEGKQEQQPTRSNMDQHGTHSEQQQNNLQRVIKQQLEPLAIVQQELQAAADPQLQQQQHKQLDDSQPLPSDSWVLLLQLSGLVQQHSSSMSSQQICTCLNGLTYLLLQHPTLPLLALQPYRLALQQLLQSAQQQLREFEPQALALVLHSAAAIARSPLGKGPSDRFVKKWYCFSRAKLPGFSPLDLSMSAWALGRLQLYPPSQWMAEFWTHSKAATPKMGPQELVMMLVGIAYVEPVPRLSTTAAAARSGWLPAVAQQLQRHLQVLSPKQLSAVMLAFARLKYQPTAAWQQRYEQVWEAQQTQFNAAGHSVVLWGVGRMPTNVQQQEVRVAWARKVQHALQAAVTRAASAVAAVALLKLKQAAAQQPKQQQAAPHSAAESRQLRQQEQQQDRNEQPELSSPATEESRAQVQAQPEQPQLLASASLLHPADCAMAISGLACLGPTALDPEFASFWLRQSKSQLGNMNSEELSVCLQSLGRLKLRPPEDWLQQAVACCAQQAACMSHQQLAMVLWGCARLQYLPNVLVTAELLMSAAEQLPSFSTHSLALLFWSLGTLRLKPNKEWMQLALRQAFIRLKRFDGQDLYCLLSALYRLRYNPGEGWLDAYVKVVTSKVQIISPSNHRMIVALLKAMGYSYQGKPYAWIMDEAAVAAMCNRI